MTASPPETSRPLRRVLHVVTSNQRRGAESSAYALSADLADRGQPTRVVALAAAQSQPALPIPVLGRRALGLATLLSLRREARAADVVIAHGSRTLPAVAVAAAGLRKGLIYQNIGDPLYWAASRARHWRVKRFLRRMTAVAALTEQSAQVLQTNFGVPEHRVSLIRNMRDGSRFRPATSPERAAARRTLALAADATVVAVIGALSPEKRVDLAIATVARLEGAVLLVAGTGAERQELKEQAERLAPGRVLFLGDVADVVPVLHAIDALLLTSDSEGVPGVLIEAGLCAVPTVSRAVGYVSDVVADKQTGILVASAEPDALADSVRQAVSDRARLGEAARKWCLGRFDTAVVLNDWSSLIDSVKTSPGS